MDKKTVEKILHLDSICLNIIAVPVLPSPPSPESNVVVYSKESVIPWRLWEATLNWRKGFSFHKGVVLEIVLLRRKVDMIGKTFSSSFVRDCSYTLFLWRNCRMCLPNIFFPVFMFAFIFHCHSFSPCWSPAFLIRDLKIPWTRR